MNEGTTLKSSIIELPYAVIIFRSEGYLHLHYKNHSLEADESKRLFDLIQKNSPWEKYPLLVSGEGIAAQSEEGRNYNEHAFVVKHCSAIAFVEPRPVRRLVFNVYARFSYRIRPTKSFSDFSSAVKWLGHYTPGNRGSFKQE